MNRAHGQAMTPQQLALARCRLEEPDVFFERGQQIHAVSVCKGCPVREACLTDAMFAEWEEPRDRRHGIFGGLLPRERLRFDADFRATHPPIAEPEPESATRPTLHAPWPELTPCRTAMPLAVVLEPQPQPEQALPCGTPEAYRQHEERGEAIDPTCWNAARRRARTKETV